jgi:hypothetical protein
MGNSLYVPWIAWEQVDIPATGYIESDSEEFRNSFKEDIVVDKILVDANSSTETFFKLKKLGKDTIMRGFIDLRAIKTENECANTADCKFPLLKLARPYVIPARGTQVVEFRDTGNNGDDIHIRLIGYLQKSKTYYSLCNAFALSAYGTGAMRLFNSHDEPLVIHALSAYMLDTAATALMRTRQVRVVGWSNRAVPFSLLCPERNGGTASVISLPGPLVLKPGEAFCPEWRDTSGSAQTVYWSAIGYRRVQ